MKVKFIPLIIGLFLSSCGENRAIELIGEWEVKEYTLLEKGLAAFKGVRSLVAGSKLTLNADSTYIENTCGNIMKGKWTHIGDSIILNRDSMWYRNAVWYREMFNADYDSIAGICSQKRTSYFFENSKLVNIYRGERYVIQSDGTKKFKSGYSMTILKQ